MKRYSWLVLPALLLIVAPAVLAHDDHAKCTKSTQACLDEMVSGMRAHGWIGLELDKSDADSALKVKRVVPGSPAEAAGFQVGDELIAVNGVTYSDKNEDALMAVKKTMAPGKQVTYTVSRAGSERKITATLASMPNEVLAQWVGMHMLDHAQNTDIAQNTQKDKSKD
jgi:C-terminal processing protease CtpA/Prc